MDKKLKMVLLASPWIEPVKTEKHQDKLWHFYFTTYSWWIVILAAALHATTYIPYKSSAVTDGAFALSFGVLLVGTLISCDWGNKVSNIWNFSNLLTHIFPFLCIFAVVLKYPTPIAPLWKTIILACLPPLMYDFAYGDRSEKLYQAQSPHSERKFMMPILGCAIVGGIFFRSFIGR